MQLANSRPEDAPHAPSVRPATRGDAAVLNRLLRSGAYSHTHIDWRLPGDWLGKPAFVLGERDGGPAGCLAIGADPPPAAWVRVAAVDSTAAVGLFRAMWTAAHAALEPDIDEVAWFLTDFWPTGWLAQVGFEFVVNVLTYRKDDLDSRPFRAPVGLVIRPVKETDLVALAAIEAEAFEPRWRQSAETLALAWRQAISFDVALIDGRPAGFQFSTGGGGRAHLSRMSVQPDWQGQGIGAALLDHALTGYRRRRVRSVTLNTQETNHASQRLYTRFGFRQTELEYPVWSYCL